LEPGLAISVPFFFFAARAEKCSYYRPNGPNEGLLLLGPDCVCNIWSFDWLGLLISWLKLLIEF